MNRTLRGLAIILITLASCAVARRADACTVGAVNLAQLRKNSDIIATGIIHVVRQTQKRNGDTEETEGVLELRTPRVLQNRIGARHPFFFRFALLITDDGCIFGNFPPDEGDRVTVYLVRTTRSPRLELIHAEVHAHAPDEEDEDSADSD
jgi:hypothetical protein